MTNAKPSLLSPKLRFREFRGTGGWQLKPLGDITKPVSDRAGSTDCVPMSITTGVGLVSQEEKFGRSIAGDSYKNYIRLRTDDFAYNKSATKEFPQGYIARYSGTKDAAVPNSIFTCFRLDAAAVVPAYLDHLFDGNHHGRWLRRYVTVGARAHGALSVSDEDLMLMPVPLPPGAASRHEQRKISDCLGSLSDVIAAEGRKLEALRQHKQGLSQQLFPRPGETQPRLRYPEFRGSPPWSDRPLTDHFAHIRNGFVGTATPHYVDRGVAYLQGRNIKRGRIDPSGLVRVSEEFHKKQAKSQLKEADILMVQSGHVGECAVVGADYAGSNCHALIVLSQRYECCSPFFAQYFGSPHGKRQIAEATTGNTIRHILASDVQTLRVPVPELDERKQIESALASSDGLIEAQSHLITALRRLKRGLLQQLVPSPEEEGW